MTRTQLDLGKALSPARVAERPAEFALCLGVGRAAELRHHDDADLAGEQLREPGRHLPRWRGVERFRERGEHLADRRGVVVRDVVGARPASLEREHGRRRGVVDVDERPDATAVPDWAFVVPKTIAIFRSRTASRSGSMGAP